MIKTGWVLRWAGVHPFYRMEAYFLGQKKKLTIGSDYNKLLGISENKRMSMYYSESDLERIHKKALKLIKNKKKMHSYLKLTVKNNGLIIKKIESTIKNIKSISNKKLARDYEKIIHLLEILFCSYDMSRPEYFDGIEKKVKEDLAEKFPDEKELRKDFFILTSNTKMTVVDDEEIDWLNIVLNAKKSGISSESTIKKIKEHENKYGWIGISEEQNPWTFEYYKRLLVKNVKMPENRIRRLLKERIEIKPGLKRKQQSLVKKLKPSRETRYFLSLIRELAFLRLNTRLAWVKTSFLMREIFKEISKRTGVSRKKLEKYRIEEMKELLIKNKRIKPAMLKKRGYYSFILKDKKLRLYFGKENVKKLEQRQVKKIDYNKISEIRGNIANPGLTSGRVKIINALSKNQEKDIQKMRKGQILVTGMTRPHLIVAIKKAAAIVTDEGGITCHAAIVAREMKKPCVIGTKIGTKVFKDGDMVEVDANKGIVRLIKK